MTYIIIAIAVFVAVNVLLFTTLLNKSRSIEKSVVRIASGENARAYPYEGGVVTVDGVHVTSYDYNGEKQFETDVERENMQAFRNGDNTVLWQTNLAIVLNSAGEVRVPHDVGETNEIIMAVCNSSQFAVAVIEEGQVKIRVFDFHGIEIWDNLFTDMTILDIGYFGEKDQQLWTLILDYHGTLPITRLYTNYPGSSQTGRITVNDQVCYALEPLDDSVYLVGTHHILSRTYTDTKLSEIMINGWALQSSYANDKDEVSFLLAPVDTTGNDVPLSALWYITPAGEQYRISMPAGILRGMLTDRKIYAVSKDGIYYMNFNGQKRNFAKLPFDTEEVVGVCGGKAVVLRSGWDYYIVGLNK
jgi:hypothetical protein